MPDFSRQFATFFPGPQIAPVGIPDPTFSSRSDLWYVPTLGTFLPYKCFFIRRFGEPRLQFDLRAKASDSGEISPRFRRNFPAIPGKFPRKFSGENGITSLPFSCSRCDDDGPHSYCGPRRRLDEVLDPLSWQEACGIGRSFWGEHGMNRRREPASWLGWKHGWHVLTDSVDTAAGWVDSAMGRAADLGGDRERRRRGGRLTLAATGSGSDGEGG